MEDLKQNQVAFYLKTLKLGENDEFSTCTRRPCVALYCHKNSRSFLNSLLVTHEIFLVYIGINYILFDVKHYEEAINLILEEEYEITQTIHDHLIQFINNFLVQPVPDDVIIERIGSTLWNTLRPFQKDNVRFGVQLPGVYIASEMGLGKTICFLALFQFWIEDGPCLIIAPKTLSHTWSNEIKKWIGDHIRIVILASSKQLKKPVPDHDVLIVSYNLFAKPDVLKFLKHNYGIVVADEAHNLKTRTAQRTLGALELFPTAKHRVLLSGTPFSYFSELYSQMKLLYPNIYPKFHTPGKNDYLQYAVEYCNPKKYRCGQTTQWEYRGCEKADELSAMLSLFLIRQTQEEVLKFLPPKIRSCFVLDELTKKEYEEIKLQEKKETKLWGPEQLEVKSFDFMESFRLTCSYKIPHVLKFLQEYVIEDVLENNPGMKVLIFCHHSNMRESVCELLTSKKIEHFSIHGATKSNLRDQYQDDFQDSDKYRVAVLSLMACNSGFTFTRATIVIFTEILFSSTIHLQSECRAYRIGQTKPVHIYYCIEPHTTDILNWKIIQKKERDMTTVVDGAAREIKAKYVTSREVSLDTGFFGKEIARHDNQPKRTKVVTRRMLEQKQQEPKNEDETISYSEHMVLLNQDANQESLKRKCINQEIEQIPKKQKTLTDFFKPTS